MSLNVAHIHSNTDWGGGENQVFQLVTRLAESGEAQVTAFLHEDGALKQRLAGTRVNVVAMPFRKGASAKALARKFRPEFEAGKFDVIHAHDSHALDAGIQLKKAFWVPLVLSRRISSPLRNNFVSRRKYSRGNLDGVIAISKTVKRIFGQSGYPEADIHMATDGLDFEALAMVEPAADLAPAQEGTFVVGGLGKLSQKKNWPFLIRVAEYLKDHELDIHWVIAGAGDEEAELRQLIADCGLKSQVELLGFRDDASAVIKALDLLFFPSLMEGASVTIREAMAQRIPVVTVDAEGSVESLAGHGWVIADRAVEAAAQAVVEALTNVAIREEKTAAARQSALERFDMDKTVQDTIAVYQHVIGEGQRSVCIRTGCGSSW